MAQAEAKGRSAKEDALRDQRPARSDLFEWNLRTDKAFDLNDDESGVKEGEPIHGLNLRIGDVEGQDSRGAADGRWRKGVVAAVGDVAEVNQASPPIPPTHIHPARGTTDAGNEA